MVHLGLTWTAVTQAPVDAGKKDDNDDDDVLGTAAIAGIATGVGVAVLGTASLIYRPFPIPGMSATRYKAVLQY